jgi:putative membrane protein
MFELVRNTASRGQHRGIAGRWRRDAWQMKIKLTWLLLSSIMVLSSASLLFQIRDFEPLFSMNASKMLIPIALTLLHASVVFTRLRGLLLILLSFLVGLAFEAVGVRFGFVFGSHYAYNSQEFGPMLLGVPLIVPMYWSVFIYLGYSISTSFLVWTNKHKPEMRRNDFAVLPVLILLDGLIVVAIDLFMDPLMVLHGKWFWSGGGPFFGIPLGNFVTWFLVTIVTTGIFRAFEWRFAQQPKQVDKSVYVAPVVAYAALCGSFAALAMDAGLHDLVLIGVAAMMPVVIVNLFCFLLWKDNSFADDSTGRTDQTAHGLHS